MTERLFRKFVGFGCVAALLVAAFGLLTVDVSPAQVTVRSSDPVEAGRSRFNIRCAGCHGQDGLGGERAPAIAGGARQGLDDEKTLRNLIQHGIPERGMPAFGVPGIELDQLVAFAQSRIVPLGKTAISGSAETGAALFFGKARCSQCHMVWGKGSISGPDLTEAARKLTLAQIETALLRPAVHPGDGYQVATVRTSNGLSVRGFIRNESSQDLQIQSFDGRLHLLSKNALVRIDREPESNMPPWSGSPEALHDLIAFLKRVPERMLQTKGPAPQSMTGGADWQAIVKPKPGNWPSYHGQLSGNRYSELAQITPQNIRNLAPKWAFSVPDQGGQSLEVTPVVMDGVMYVTRV